MIAAALAQAASVDTFAAGIFLFLVTWHWTGNWR
jgi:hypothetical protein